MSSQIFHPAVSEWFDSAFQQPTEIQNLAWPAIQRGHHTLISAPTGAGKTLAAFLSSINDLIEDGLRKPLENQTRVLYISPLKTLSNDIQKNLQQPLQGIRDKLLEHGLPDVEIRAVVRTGDTPQSEREKMRRTPPHILVTTPESLYILLTSSSGREILSDVRSVIVDEIHAVAGSKRGAHLMLSLERLQQLTGDKLVRIGLSATQKPIQAMASFLIGNRSDHCEIVNLGHNKERNLTIATTASPLEAVMANEVWGEIYDHLESQINAHQTTLIFVNTRRLSERMAHALAERIGEDNITAHHGSLSREHRQSVEHKLKTGQLKALVATASLELGIDIGDIDLVCQIGSPGSIATFLQRVGRSGHSLKGIPKGQLYPLTRDDLVESIALIDAIRQQELDRIIQPEKPLDVLAQQIVAEVAFGDRATSELLKLLRLAAPYKNLEESEFNEILNMLANGFTLKRGRRGAYLHWDQVNHVIKARRNAKLVAIMNGGTIPEQFDYDVILQPEGISIGTLNEDFAFESLPGDIFQLGNTSYRMLKIEQGRVFVQDAKGQPPNIPFWFGEAPGRSDELSFAVSRLRNTISTKLNHGIEYTTAWIIQNYNLSLAAAKQLSEYLAGAKATLEVIPSQTTIVFERFFDETGDMHLVIHSPYGSRINRAWGLALRKRFCRKFNFELQAAAAEDNIVLSLGATHSFPLEEVKRYLHSNTVRQVLTQALLDAPMFPTRWRWVANIALAIPRMRNGKKVPAPFQRNDSEDLLALIFPDQIACQENIQGDREIPDHPLVKQSLSDCLNELMDIDGLERLLKSIENESVKVVCKDLAGPSPLAHEIINARPYAFLDDTAAEERRTLAIQQRRSVDPADLSYGAALNPDAIQTVRLQAWPEVNSADELHDALMLLSCITQSEGLGQASSCVPIPCLHNWGKHLDELIDHKRALKLNVNDKLTLWIARERLAEFSLAYPGVKRTPRLNALKSIPAPENRTQAVQSIVRSRLEGLGPVTVEQLTRCLGLPEKDIDLALQGLEQAGVVIQGRFTPDAQAVEWCERGLLARISRYTLKQARSEIEPVSPAVYMQYLFQLHHMHEPLAGQESTALILQQLEGFPIAAGVFEKDILASRLSNYAGNMLDNLCLSGRFTWLRLYSHAAEKSSKRATPLSIAPISLMSRSHLAHWTGLSKPGLRKTEHLSSNAKKVLTWLKTHGASFFLDILHDTGLLRTQIEDAMAELAASGWITADNFSGLRTLLNLKHKGINTKRPKRAKLLQYKFEESGRWSVIRHPAEKAQKDKSPGSGSDKHPARLTVYDEARQAAIEHIARTLLKRYGVVFRKVLEREPHLPPWRELLYVYRTLEARGEIRGGRFVQGFSGEQFALPDAASQLRKIRKDKAETSYSISAVDPLNLTGIITPGIRVSAVAGNRVLYRNGVPVAHLSAGTIHFLTEHDSVDEWETRNALLLPNRKADVADQSSLIQ